MVLVDFEGSPPGPTKATFLALSSSVPASCCCLSLPLISFLAPVFGVYRL